MRTARPVVLSLALAFASGCGGTPAPGGGGVEPAAPQPALVPAGSSSPAATKPRYFDRVVALCVGIERYRSPGVSPADGAERDAAELARLFRDRYGYKTVELVGREATRGRILGELDRLKRELGERDALLVFFAGHGKVVDLPSFGRAGYLVPFDADLDLEDASDPAAWASRALDMRALAASVEGARAAHVVFLVDACFSGFMARRGISPAQSEAVARRSRCVVAATTETQTATSRAATGHGHFTGALLEQLGGTEARSLTDVFSRVREDVVARSKRSMLPQRGDFGGEDGEFVFIPLAVPEAAVAEAVRYVGEQAALRAKRRTTRDELLAAYTAFDYRNGPLHVELDAAWRGRVERFRGNASAGDPLALAALAVCTAKGLGTDPDPREAFRLARLAYDTGRPEAVVALHHCLSAGVGCEVNRPAAEQIVATGFTPGAPPVVRWLALQARFLSGRTLDEMEACRAGLEELSSAGLAVAAVPEGFYWTTVRRQLPPEAARRLTPALETLAAADDPEAHYLLYQFAVLDAAPRDPERVAAAVRHLERSAALGHPSAQAMAAVEFYRDTEWLPRPLGLDPDLPRAVRWAEYGSKQKQAVATKVLAMALCFGDGTKKDPRRASDLAWALKKEQPREQKWWLWLHRACEERER